MNNSGQPVSELINYFSIPTSSVFVWHDEIDLKQCKVRVKRGGGHGGHNGVRDIIKHIGNNFNRIRIGIGRPKKNSTGADHVLDNFSGDEKQNVEKITKSITESLSILISKDLDLFSSKINQK